MSETAVNSGPETSATAGVELTSEKAKRILLVEGDGFTRIVLLLQLRLAGFKVDFTSNGYLGLGKLRTCRPDVLLLELKLCGLSGLDLIKAARAEPAFADRPIYVFTHTERLSRNARKELLLLATKVFDKNAMTREELVQTFAAMFRRQVMAKPAAPAGPSAKLPAETVGQVVSSEEIEEIVAGVREQCELLATDGGHRDVNAEELLSRVCSLSSCAEAARLPNLARQAKAVERFLSQLRLAKKHYTEAALRAVTRGVEVMSRMSSQTNGTQQRLSRFTAVVVDEAPRSHRALEKALREAGFEPACFEEPGQARKQLASKPTDLIIANLALPEAHGLALADIRQLPLHAETPVIFGPESDARHGEEDLPTSAPKLDGQPLLIAELVVKALNEVQSPPAAEADAPQQPLADPATVAALPAEDGFELFAKAPSHQSFEGIVPDEPFSPAQPGTAGTDREAEFLIRLPSSSVDESQTDERAIEALQPSALYVEAVEPPQAETGEDQAAAGAWLTAAASEAGQATTLDHTTSTLPQNEAAAFETLDAGPQTNGEVMNNQLHIASAEYAQDAQAYTPPNPHEDLAARVCAAEMALYHAKAEVEQKDKAIEALQNQLVEVTANRGDQEGALAGQSEAEQRALARCAELEQEVASLRQVFEGFDGGLVPGQGSNAETDKRVQELEQRLSQQTTELEQQREAYQRAEAELRAQLEEAKAAVQPSEVARQQSEGRCAQLEQELAAVRRAHDELASKQTQKSSRPGDQAGVPESELEQQVRQGVAALARATAELAKERGERQRSQQRAAELNGRLQALHDDLRRTLQAQREDLARISSLEEENRQMTQALEQRTADVEQHQAEQRLAEEQLEKVKEANAQLRKDLAFFEEANKKFGGGRQELQARLEASLNAARENEVRLQQEVAERQRLAESLEETKREVQNQVHKREILEKELQAAQEAVQDREAQLQKEAAERQRLNEALRSVQGNAHDRSERDLELTKLQSSLEEEQVERKRQETQLARIRQKAVDAAHAARALRTNLRRQIREPVDNLVHSTRSLLEMELNESQKQLAESVLQDVLLVQTRLREPELTQGDAAEALPPNPAT